MKCLRCFTHCDTSATRRLITLFYSIVPHAIPHNHLVLDQGIRLLLQELADLPHRRRVAARLHRQRRRRQVSHCEPLQVVRHRQQLTHVPRTPRVPAVHRYISCLLLAHRSRSPPGRTWVPPCGDSASSNTPASAPCAAAAPSPRSADIADYVSRSRRPNSSDSGTPGIVRFSSSQVSSCAR